MGETCAPPQEVLIRNDVVGDDVGRHQTDLIGLVVEGRNGRNLHLGISLGASYYQLAALSGAGGSSPHFPPGR
jgi:hypothetical protein